jgi:cytochrome c biogenesis protein CcdA
MKTTTAPPPTEDDVPDLPWPVSRRALRAGEPVRVSWVRRVPAVVVDMVLHFVAALVVVVEVLVVLTATHVVTADDDAGSGLMYVIALLVAYLGVSFVHRVFLQRWWGATVGRAVSGLRAFDPKTRRPPTLGRLALGWLFGLLATVAALFDG